MISFSARRALQPETLPPLPRANPSGYRPAAWPAGSFVEQRRLLRRNWRSGRDRRFLGHSAGTSDGPGGGRARRCGEQPPTPDYALDNARKCVGNYRAPSRDTHESCLDSDETHGRGLRAARALAIAHGCLAASGPRGTARSEHPSTVDQR